jgi:magnesium and cobalt exporter, CNNM family
MLWLAGLVAVLFAFGSLLAVAESAISRMTRVRAAALGQEGRRNAALLERIELDPAPYLNSLYLAVMFVQNGSAILVAILSEGYFGDVGIMLVAVAFTLAYFVVVEAMSKTYGVLHSDQAALMVAPVVWLLGRVLAHPTRALIGLANILLPGKGLKQGPFVSQQDICSMAEVGHEEGVIEEAEKRMIHSVFAFSDTVVSRIMTPRPDIVALEIESPLPAVLDVIRQHGFSRIPVYRGDLDRVEGVIHVTDVVTTLQRADGGPRPADLMRPVRFVPESKRLADLLREMRLDKFHMAIVVDEYGSTTGLVTLEDVLEELVGEIGDEHDVEERDVEPIGDGVYRVDASVGIRELNELLGADLPHDRWNTVGGLLFALVGTIPTEGQSVTLKGFRFTAEKVQGRRVTTVLVAVEDGAARPVSAGSS